MESISLNSWARLVQYHCLRELLGPAINTHLAGNELLREVFQMGPPPVVTVETKAAKLDRVSVCAHVLCSRLVCSVILPDTMYLPTSFIQFSLKVTRAVILLILLIV